MPKIIKTNPAIIPFVAGMSAASKKRLQRTLGILREVGFLTFPHARKIAGHDNLFEIRILTRGNERVFYAYAAEDAVWLLHAFAKRTRATPPVEIEKALIARRLYVGE